MHKTAIAVHDPSDPLEKAIQAASYKYNQEWLPSYLCQLMANSIGRLKCFDDWAEKEDLINQRISYFFTPQMANVANQCVFVTHKLFLRDILENEEIDSYLHDPIVFCSKAVAHYVLRDYPILVMIDTSCMRALNHKVHFWQVGGLLMVDGESIKLTDECILDVIDRSEQKTASASISKTAVLEIADGVFENERQDRGLRPDTTVVDKENKKSGRITLVEPGDTGFIHVSREDGIEEQVSKVIFDQKYIVQSKTAAAVSFTQIPEKILAALNYFIPSKEKWQKWRNTSYSAPSFTGSRERYEFRCLNVPIRQGNDVNFYDVDVDVTWKQEDPNAQFHSDAGVAGLDFFCQIGIATGKQRHMHELCSTDGLHTPTEIAQYVASSLQKLSSSVDSTVVV